MRTWYSAVILALNYKGGKSVDLQDIYSEISRFRPLSDHDRELPAKYPQENYKHTIRSVLAKLKRYGFVHNPDRAVYSLAEKSTKHLGAFERDSKGRRGSSEESFREFLKGLGIE